MTRLSSLGSCSSPLPTNACILFPRWSLGGFRALGNIVCALFPPPPPSKMMTAILTFLIPLVLLCKCTNTVKQRSTFSTCFHSSKQMWPWSLLGPGDTTVTEIIMLMHCLWECYLSLRQKRLMKTVWIIVVFTLQHYLNALYKCSDKGTYPGRSNWQIMLTC